MSDKYKTFGHAYNASLDQPPYFKTFNALTPPLIGFFISRPRPSPPGLIFGSIGDLPQEDWDSVEYPLQGIFPATLHLTSYGILDQPCLSQCQRHLQLNGKWHPMWR